MCFYYYIIVKAMKILINMFNGLGKKGPFVVIDRSLIKIQNCSNRFALWLLLLLMFDNMQKSRSKTIKQSIRRKHHGNIGFKHIDCSYRLWKSLKMDFCHLKIYIKSSSETDFIVLTQLTIQIIFIANTNTTTSAFFWCGWECLPYG